MFRMKNAISIDLEDWFCVHNLSGVIKPRDWDNCELRVQQSTERLLASSKTQNARDLFRARLGRGTSAGVD